MNEFKFVINKKANNHIFNNKIKYVNGTIHYNPYGKPLYDNVYLYITPSVQKSLSSQSTCMHYIVYCFICEPLC